MSENRPPSSQEFSDLDLRKLDLTRKYDEDFSQDEGITWRDHVLLYTICALVAFFLIWASISEVDEVARGEGRVIPSSEVQVIANLEGGIIEEFPVKEGDHVKAGQVVLRMRDIQAKADYGSTYQKYLALQAAVIRLQAEADGATPTFSEEVTKNAPESVRAEQATFEANRRQLSQQADVLKEQMSQRQQEVEEILRRTEDAEKLLRLSQDERAMVAPMVERGAASRKELLQLDQQIASRRADLNGQRVALPRVQAAVKEAQNRLNEQQSTFRAEAQKDLSQKIAELSTLKESLAAFQDKSARTEIHAPMTGTVKDIKIKTVGGVARPGEPIMEIVPIEDRLIIEAKVKPSDIAFIQPGAKAIVRLTAFDFSIFGGIEGEVLDISADSLVNEKGESFYRVKISTQQTQVKRGHKIYKIIPGMQATVDILTGKKTILAYLLKPFIKASQTALRER